MKILTKENDKMNIKERKEFIRILNKVTKGGKEDNLKKKWLIGKREKRKKRKCKNACRRKTLV